MPLALESENVFLAVLEDTRYRMSNIARTMHGIMRTEIHTLDFNFLCK